MAAAELTEAQLRLLDLLEEAYEADRPIRLGGQTQWGAEPTAHRRVAAALVDNGLAYYSPEGNFLLITKPGRQVAQARAAS